MSLVLSELDLKELADWFIDQFTTRCRVYDGDTCTALLSRSAGSDALDGGFYGKLDSTQAKVLAECIHRGVPRAKFVEVRTDFGNFRSR